MKSFTHLLIIAALASLASAEQAGQRPPDTSTSSFSVAEVDDLLQPFGLKLSSARPSSPAFEGDKIRPLLGRRRRFGQLAYGRF